MPIVLKEQWVCLKLVFDVRDVDASLESGVGDREDERVLVGLFEGAEHRKNKRSPRGLTASAEADDLKEFRGRVLKRGEHLRVEFAGSEIEMVWKVKQAKAYELLAYLTTDCGIAKYSLERLFRRWAGRGLSFHRLHALVWTFEE